MTPPKLLAFLVLLTALASAALGAGYSPDTLAKLDRQFQGDAIAISPDGRHVAYTTYEGTKLSLVITDLDRKVGRKAMLLEDKKTSLPPSRLKRLKWLSPFRLLIETAEGDLFTCDENGLYAVRLWGRDENGLVNDMQMDRGLLINPGPPRFMGLALDSMEDILLESVANIGAESFSNLYKVNGATGIPALANQPLYAANQVALYGRGDMILWPPEPPADPGEFTMQSPTAARAAALAAAGFVGAGTAALDKPTREEMRAQAHPTLAPEQGGPVSRDSSSTGRMLYDRNGNPRILYAKANGDAVRPFLMTQGRDVFQPNIAPTPMDRWLGQDKRGEFVITADNYFHQRSYPLAFDYDPDTLYFASNVGRDTYGIYKLNMLTKAREEVPFGAIPYDLAGLEPEFPQSNLIFDDYTRKMVGIRVTAVRPQTVWLDAGFAAIQARASAAFPRHTAEIVDWDASRRRILLRVSAEDDPGMYCVLDTSDGLYDVLFSRSPWLSSGEVRQSSSFSFETKAGVRLTGYVTLPEKPKVEPPPLMIYLQGGLWDRADPDFNRESQMLADMGLTVIRLNFRGTIGFGQKHLMAIADGLDSVPLEDMIATVDWMASKYKIDRRKVMVMGEGFGGYLALRAMQLRPDLFKAAISLNAPTNLSAWSSVHPMKTPYMYKDGSVERGVELDFNSRVRAAFVRDTRKGEAQPTVEGEYKKPVLVIENPASENVTATSTLLSKLGLTLRGTKVERLSISGPFENGSPDTRRKVFARIEEFLNDNFYEFGTDIRNMRPVDAPPPFPSVGGRIGGRGR